MEILMFDLGTICTTTGNAFRTARSIGVILVAILVVYGLVVVGVPEMTKILWSPLNEWWPRRVLWVGAIWAACLLICPAILCGL